MSNSSDKAITANCPAGKTIVGGGATASLTNGDIVLYQSGPSSIVSNKATAWTAGAAEMGNIGGNWTITAYAVCASA